jgi:hypothetical protein
MAQTNRYSGYCAKFVGSSTLDLVQCHSVSVNLGASKIPIIPSGALNPLAIPMMFAQPTVTLRTHDLAAALTAVSITNGLAVTSALIQYQGRDDGATFTSGSTHTVLSCTKGWLAITGITASQDSPAEITLGFWPLFDGTNIPFVSDGTAALTSTPAFGSMFSLGPIYANSVEIPGIQSVTVNPGINYQVNRESGDVYARTGSIHSRSPSISFSTFKASLSETSGILFNAALPGTFAAYFWKMVHGGSRVAAATTEHCKLSAAAGVWSMDSGEASDTGDAMFSYTTQPINTIAESHASAIP